MSAGRRWGPTAAVARARPLSGVLPLKLRPV